MVSHSCIENDYLINDWKFKQIAYDTENYSLLLVEWGCLSSQDKAMYEIVEEAQRL
jgi:hypothetical protein